MSTATIEVPRDSKKMLNAIACQAMGDGDKSPLFFVSEGSKGTTTITTDFVVAYTAWVKLRRANVDCTLESRKMTVCTHGYGQQSEDFSVSEKHITKAQRVRMGLHY